MNRKPLLLLIIPGSLLLVLALFFSLPTQNAEAQCAGTSSCKNCHEVQGANPVNTSGAWHSDHVVFDYCAQCHLGDPEAATKEAAHVGLVTKFQDMGAACKDCHAKDLDQKLAGYASTLNISDLSTLKNQPAAQTRVTPTPAPELGSFLGMQPVEVGSEVKGASTSTLPTVPAREENTTANLILAGLLVLGVVGGGGYITWNERRLTKLHGKRQTSWLMTMLQKEHWSPYAAGVLLGFTCILAVLLANHTLGASSGIASLASNLLQNTLPALAGDSLYFKFVMPPGFNWEIALLIGVFFGGMLGSLTSGTFRLRWNDDPTWKKVFGEQCWKRFVAGFLGAVLLQYGAGIAGGCTSGLAISGGMLLAPSAFLFIAGMFTTGILAAIVIFRRRY